MPTQQGVRLDDEEGLLPELVAAGQEEESKAVAIGEMGLFHLAFEHDEPLSQHHILGDEVGAGAGCI